MSVNQGSVEGENGGDRLTGKQARFVEEWIGTRFNGRLAAKNAGYAGDENALASQASKNLRKAKIQRAIAAKLDGHGGSAEEVIAQLLELARFSDPARFMLEGGQLDYAKVKEYGHLIQSVHKMKDGWRIQCYSRLDALKELARILKAGGLDQSQAQEINVYLKGEAPGG